MNGTEDRKKRKKKSVERDGALQIKTSDKESAGAAPLIITDTLHYPRRNVHTDVFVYMRVLVHNDRRV